jgi:hypothetical protein
MQCIPAVPLQKSAFQRTVLKFYFLIVFLALLMFSGTFTGCTTSSGTETSATETGWQNTIVLAAAQGGNLHYQNLVLEIGDRIVFNSSDGQLCLAASDGSANQIIYDLSSSSPVFCDDTLYFVEGSASGKLAKIDLDGSNQVRIGQTPLKYLLCHDSTLYAIESENGKAISLQPDGTGRRLLVESQAIALTMSGDRLFITGAEASSGLTMIDLPTGEKTIVLNQRISSLNVSGDWLYFSDPAAGFRLTACSLPQKSCVSISSFSVDKPFVISGGYIYFVIADSQNRLFRLPVDGNQKLDGLTPALVVDDAVESFAICGSQVYYQRPASSRIYRIAVTGGTSLRIT